MQEQLLAPRTLNFGVFTVWECQQRMAHRMHPGWRYDYYSRKSHLKQSFAASVLQKTSHRQGIIDKVRLNLWRRLLVAYTETELTYPTDRLAATSGII